MQALSVLRSPPLVGNARQVCIDQDTSNGNANRYQWQFVTGPEPAGGAGHVRICFATSRGILQEAFDRLDSVVMKMVAEKQ